MDGVHLYCVTILKSHRLARISASTPSHRLAHAFCREDVDDDVYVKKYSLGRRLSRRSFDFRYLRRALVRHVSCLSSLVCMHFIKTSRRHGTREARVEHASIE